MLQKRGAYQYPELHLIPEAGVEPKTGSETFVTFYHATCDGDSLHVAKYNLRVCASFAYIWNL
jgi:hypothetical protein